MSLRNGKNEKKDEKKEGKEIPPSIQVKSS